MISMHQQQKDTKASTATNGRRKERRDYPTRGLYSKRDATKKGTGTIDGMYTTKNKQPGQHEHVFGFLTRSFPRRRKMTPKAEREPDRSQLPPPLHPLGAIASTQDDRVDTSIHPRTAENR